MIRIVSYLFFVVIVPGILQNVQAEPSRLSTARSFAYQLQGFSIEQLAASTYDVLIIDYSFDGTSAGAVTRSQVDAIKVGHPNRKVLAYLSIGEAERYRYYFSRSWIQRGTGACKVRPSRRAPAWLGDPNPSFCDNFNVKFWDRTWRDVLFTRKKGRSGYLDRIIAAGFDGVYLDIIDGYRHWDREEGNGIRPRAATDMATLVLAIAKHARVTKKMPGFIVVPQNGSDILDEIPPLLSTKYLEAIDAIGAEDTFYFGDADENNSLDPQAETIRFLERFIEYGRPVLAVDYVTDASKISDFVSRACAAGFIPQVARRELDTLSDNAILGCPGNT